MKKNVKIVYQITSFSFLSKKETQLIEECFEHNMRSNVMSE